MADFTESGAPLYTEPARQGDAALSDAEHTLNVQAVEIRTGVCAETLRSWERRYGWPRPRRMANGYRAYSEDDVALILAVKREMERGAVAATAWQRVLATMSLCTACPAVRSPEWLSSSLVSAFLAFDADGALSLLAEAHGLYPLERVLAGIIQPAFATIGDRWHLGEATVAHEHFATQLVRDSLALIARAYRSRHCADTVFVGAAPGERHEMGALMLSVLLRRGGHRVIYLGQDVSLEGLGAVIVQARARALLLSAAQRETAHALIAVPRILDGIEPRPLFVFGGQIFARHPDLAAQIDGIYIQGDAATAAARLDELLAGRR